MLGLQKQAQPTLPSGSSRTKDRSAAVVVFAKDPKLFGDGFECLETLKALLQLGGVVAVAALA